MNSILSGFTAKILPRLAGIAASYVVGEAAKRGLTLDPAETVAAMLAAYAFVHRFVSKYTNPGDATKSALIVEDKAKVATAPVAPVAARDGQVNVWSYGKDEGDL